MSTRDAIFYLIEDPQRPGDVARWWGGTRMNFTPDANDAVRFPCRKNAEDFKASYFETLPHLIVTEHAWPRESANWNEPPADIGHILMDERGAVHISETIRCANCGRECEPINDSDMPVTECVLCAPRTTQLGNALLMANNIEREGLRFPDDWKIVADRIRELVAALEAERLSVRRSGAAPQGETE